MVKFSGFSPFLPALASSIFYFRDLFSSIYLGGDLLILSLVDGPPIFPAKIPVFLLPPLTIDLIKSDAKLGFLVYTGYY